jgi:Ser/Thr protein kinase RdoA (MazF antagonist)
METVRDFVALASRALTEYGLSSPALTFIQHSENVTFKVESGAAGYLLRLHVPRSPSFGSHGEDRATIRSELQWLEALSRNHLPVQHPVRNRADDLVTQLEDYPNGFVNCSLLTWLEGDLYTRELETPDTVAQIGTLVGQLHLHASRWRPPHGFLRPRRDIAYYERVVHALEPAVEDGRVAYQDFKSLQAAVEVLIGLIRGMRKSRKTEGLIHADLHRGNFIYQQGHVSPIDFSFCAFGHFAFDLGICLASISPTLHPVFLVNYDRLFALPQDFGRLIEAFFIGGYVGTLALWVSDPDAQETLAQRVPYIAREFAARFNRDERFWFNTEDA